MREGLTIIIVLLIAGIVLDAVRRMRRSRRESLRLSRNARKLDLEDMPEPSSELSEPRVVRKRDVEDAANLTRSVRESWAKSRVTVGVPQRIPEQVALNLQESVPLLMESVEDDESAADDHQLAYTQPPAWRDAGPLGPRRERPRQAPADRTVAEPQLGDLDQLEDKAPYETAEQAGHQSQPAQSAWAETAADNFDEAAYTEANPDDAAEVAEQTQERELREPEEVLIMNLMAPAGERFQGDELLQALLDEGLRFGAMDIFHRHKNTDGSGPIQFSLANMVVPGTFDLASMSEFSTPGVSMFLSLPCEDDSIAAYDTMARTARNLADRLGGDLKDENRSVMTRQTIEHGRQRVLEFERRQRLNH